MKKFVISGIIIVFLIILAITNVTIVHTGEVGIRINAGQVEDICLQPGIYFTVPIVQNIKKVVTKQQDKNFSEKIWSETSERTAIYYENVTVTYSIDGNSAVWIMSNVSDIKNMISSGMVSSAIKTISKNFNSVDATNRGLVEPAIQTALQSSVDTKYGFGVITIHKIVIGNIDFEDTYNAAIAEKQNAQIEYEKAQIENQRRVEQAEADAVVTKTSAQAEADATIIKAKAEAEANDIVSKSLNETIIKKMWYDKWDGVLPRVYGGADNLIEIPIN